MFEYHKKESPIISLLGMGGGIGSYIFTAADTGYEIARSLRFNSADSAYLSYSGSAGSNTTWTLSTWIKKTGNDNHVFGAGDGNTPGRFGFGFNGSDKIFAFVIASGSTVFSITTDAVFRDSSAWYHVVLVADTTNGTQADRFKIYVNGVLQTVSGTLMPSSQNTFVNTAAAHAIGRRSYTASDYFNGYLADVWLIDGSALEPTEFGTFDTYGVWQPKRYTGSATGNSFHLPFSDNTSATTLGYDDSGNNNNWDVYNISSGTPRVDSYDIPTAANLSNSNYIEFPVTYTSTTTYELFVRITNPATYIYFAQDALGPTQDQWNIGVNTSDSLLFGSFNGGWTTFTNAGLADGNWHFVRLTTTGSSTSLYVDGVLVGTNASGGSVTTGTQTNKLSSAGAGTLQVAHLRITSGGTPPTTGIPDPSTMNTAAGSGGTLLFYDALDSLSGTGTITSDGGGVTITVTNAVSSSTVNGIFNDSLLDSPSNDTDTGTGVGGELAGNYCTLNPLDKASTLTLSNGNLEPAATGNSISGVKGTIRIPTSGKFYAEGTAVSWAASGYFEFGIALPSLSNTDWIGVSGGTGFSIEANGTTDTRLRLNGTNRTIAGAVTSGDVLQMAVDYANSKVWFGKNNTWYDNAGGTTGDPANGSNPTGTLSATESYLPAVVRYGTNNTVVCNYGQRAFSYSAPTGFKALNTANLPTPTIEEPSNYVGIVTYSGNGTSQTISGLNFAPDFVWIKRRSTTQNNRFYDTVRGAGVQLYSDVTDQEDTNLETLSSFENTGFSVGSNPGVNAATDNAYVAWAWKAGGSSDTFNIDGTGYSTASAAGLTSGSITPTGASVNTTTKFSVVTWTGTSASGTVDHGLGVAPQLIIARRRNGVANWCVYHVSTGASQGLNLQTTAAAFANTTRYDGTTPTSDVFSVGTSGDINAGNALAYCWAPVKGYSAFGSFTGNGLADGPFIELGFRPAVIITKAYGTTSQWGIWDAERDPYNPVGRALYPSLANGEVPAGTYPVDFLSNGFKVRSTANFLNATSGVIYAAWAEDPFRSVRAR